MSETREFFGPKLSPELPELDAEHERALESLRLHYGEKEFTNDECGIDPKVLRKLAIKGYLIKEAVGTLNFNRLAKLGEILESRRKNRAVNLKGEGFEKNKFQKFRPYFWVFYMKISKE